MPKKLTSNRKSKKPSTAPSKDGADREVLRLEVLLKLMNEYGLGELELEDERGRVFARKIGSGTVTYSSSELGRSTGAVTAAQAHLPAPTATASAASSATTAKPAAANDQQKKILSPFVGTFYKSASPTSEPYVKEGQTVKKGQTLCIIEAMKLMNEIESDFNGKIVSVLVENGQPVEFGEPLFLIET